MQRASSRTCSGAAAPSRRRGTVFFVTTARARLLPGSKVGSRRCFGRSVCSLTTSTGPSTSSATGTCAHPAAPCATVPTRRCVNSPPLSCSTSNGVALSRQHCSFLYSEFAFSCALFGGLCSGLRGPTGGGGSYERGAPVSIYIYTSLNPHPFPAQVDDWCRGERYIERYY